MPRILYLPKNNSAIVPDNRTDEQAMEWLKSNRPEIFLPDAPPPEPAKPEPGITSEIGSILKSGAGQGIAGLGKLGQYAGIGGKGLEEYGSGMTKSATEALSPGTQAALQRQFLQAAPEGQGFLGYQLGDAKLTDIPAQFLQSVPVMAGTMAAAVGATALAPASAVTGVGTGVLGLLGRVGLGKVAGRITTAAGAEAGAAEALAGKLAINTLAGNVAEGLAAAGSSGIETEKAINDFAKLNPDGFFRSPIGQQALQDADGDKNKAIELGAFRAGRSAAALTGVSTAILATPGSAFESLAVFGKGAKSGRVRNAILGGITEGPAQELPQGSAEQYIQNLQRIQAGEPISPGKGVLEAGVQGAIIGTPMGGALGAITGSGKAQELPPLDTQFQGLASKYQENGLNATTAYHTAARDIEKYAQPGETLTVHDSLGRDIEATIVGKNETGKTIANVAGGEFVLGNEFTVSDPKDGRYGFKKGDEFVASSELNRDEVTAAVDNIRTVIKQFNDEFEQTKVKTPEHYSAERQGTSLDAADAILEAKEKKAQEEAVKPKTAKKPVVQAPATTPAPTAAPAPAAVVSPVAAPIATDAVQTVAPVSQTTEQIAPEPIVTKVTAEYPLMVYRQEDDPNPFPEGMNYAVGDGVSDAATYFKTNKEAQAFLKNEQDYSESLKTPATTEAPPDIQAAIDAASAAGQRATTEQEATQENAPDYQVFYDRSKRLWTAFRINSAGDQTANASYGTTKQQAIDEMPTAEESSRGYQDSAAKQSLAPGKIDFVVTPAQVARAKGYGQTDVGFTFNGQNLSFYGNNIVLASNKDYKDGISIAVKGQLLGRSNERGPEFIDELKIPTEFKDVLRLYAKQKIDETQAKQMIHAAMIKLAIISADFQNSRVSAKQSRAPKGAKKVAPAAQNTLRQLLTGMREARNKEYYDKALPRVTALIYKRMNQIGLGKYVSNEFLASIKAGKDVESNGEYVERLIKLAIAGKSDKQIMSTLDHESIHAMRAIGMITDAEWKNLKTLVDKRNWLETFLIDIRYDKTLNPPTEKELKTSGLTREAWIKEAKYEEAIADAFATYTNGRSPVLGYDVNNQPVYVYKKDLNLAGQPVGIINRILKILGIVKDVVSEDTTFKRFVEAPIEADAAKLKAETASPKLSVANIKDGNILNRIAEIEGETFVRQQEQGGRYTVKAIQDELSDLKDAGYGPEDLSNRVIYGKGGYNRYQVGEDGSVRPIKSSFDDRKDQYEKAVSVLGKRPEETSPKLSVSKADLGREKTGQLYEVYNRKTGKVVGGPYQTRSTARSGADRNDNKYGGYAHDVREVQEFGSDEGPEPTKQDLKKAREEEKLEALDEAGVSQKFSVAPRINTEAFKRWFGDSKVVDENGEPLVVYHGTSYDISSFPGRPDKRNALMKVLNLFDLGYGTEYGEFGARTEARKNALERGATWFTASSELASGYSTAKRPALGKKTTFSDAKFSGANVMPVYLSIKRPVIYDAVTKILTYPNGKIIDFSKAWGGVLNDFTRTWDIANNLALSVARRNGADGVILRGVFDAPNVELSDHAADIYITFQPTQIKSSIGNTGAFDSTNPDIRRSVAPRITKNIVKNAKGLYIYKGKLPESFYKWFGKSAVTDDDGYPLVMFHGTARDITEFKPKQANAIFVTTDTKTAFNFSELSRAWVMEHLDDFITPERQKEIRVEARKTADSSKERNKQTAFIDELDRLTNNELKSENNLMPLFVRAENPFDYEDKKHIDAIRKEFDKDSDFSKEETNLIFDTVQKGSWQAIEREEVQDAIRAAGFDGFFAKEEGQKNLAVYDPNQVKSVTGNSGEYSRESKDIRRSVAPKFAKDTNAAYASRKEVNLVRSIIPVHPESMEHMREKFLWDTNDTGDYKNDRRVFQKGNKKLVIGRITPQDWIDRVELMLKPQERIDSRHWYKNIKLEFQKMFDDEWPKYMVSYLLGNKAESPRGALNNTLYVAEEIKTMTSGTRSGGLSDEQMRQIFKGDPVSLVGIGAKLYDFVDSALGKTTRAWMGNTIEGNSPFVVDRHTLRDSGRVDPALLSYIQENFGEDAASGIVLDSPTTGNVSSPQYEKITTWGNELTENLNELKYLGGNWTPLEVQAVGWMAMSRLTETAAGGTTEGAFDAMTKTLPVELDFGAGAPYNIKFKDWHDLSSEAKSRVTYKAMREVADVVAEFTGTKVRDFTEGVGGWGSYVNPNAVIRFLASDQTAEALSAMAAYLGHQTKVLAFHPANGQTGDSVAFDIAPVGNTPFTNKDIAEKIWPELFKSLDPVMGRDADGDPKIGFVQAKTSDGRPTIRIIVSLPTQVFSSGPKKGSLKDIKDLSVPERNISEKSLVDKIAPVIQTAIKNIAGNYSFDYGRVRVVSSTNNWKEQKNGDSHRQRVEKRFGLVLQGRLDAVGVPRVESAIQKAIDEEQQTGGEKLSVAPRLEQAGNGGRRREKSGRITPLQGSPSVPSVNGPDSRIVAVAQRYARDNGIDLKRQAEYVEVDPVRGKRLADAYEAMANDPSDPVVKEAYANLIKQTAAQYRALEAAGYKFWFINFEKPENIKYAESPWNAIRDIRANQEMGVFPTTSGFGTDEFDVSGNPLLANTGIEWPDGGIDGPLKPVLANDLFRAVHDAFGHGLEGAGFRAQGEDNAWQGHIRMYTGSAKGAITSETRGQNSVVNFGPNAEFNRTANGADTIYADQKIGLMPKWTWTEGIAKDEPEFRELDAEQDAEMFRKAVDRVKRGRKMAFPLHVHDVETYRNARLFLSEDKESGFALMGDEIGSFFSGGGGQAYPTLRLAVEEGGRRIDAYRSVMPRVLGKAGFRPVARVAFDPSQATEIWDYKKFERFQGGTPDLVFFAYDSISKKSEQVEELVKKAPLVQYDEALALQAEAAGAENASGKYSHAMRYPDMLKANWPLVPETSFYRENPERDDIAIYKGKFIQLPWGDDKKSFGMDHILHNAIRQSNRRWEQVTDKDDENAILGIIDILGAKDLKVFKESPLDDKIIIRSGKFKRAIILGENKDDLRIISVVPSEIPKFGKIIDQTPDVKMSDKVLYQYKNNFTGIKVNFRFETPPATVTVKKTRSYELPKQSIAPKFTVSPYIGATGSFGGSQIPTTFAAPASSKLTDHIYTWADKFVDLKNLQVEIEKTIGQLDDQYNALQKEELYHSKVAGQFKDFMRQEVLPLYNAMKEENVTPEKLNEYVHNRHAEERNDQIDKVNQGVVQGIVGKGSGIATQDARDYLNNLTAQETASLDRVAKMLDGIMQKTRALMVSSGLEEQGTIDAWEKTYTSYVPLERVLGDPDETNTGFTGQGQGYSVSKSVKRAMGSTLDVDHIIANILSTRERTIVRAEKNEIDKAIYALAIKAPNPNIWIAVDPELPRNTRKNLASFLATFGGFTLTDAKNIAAFPETRSIDRQTGLVTKGRNPQLAKADNVLHLMIAGKEKLVFFNSRNKQANRLVRTLKNLDTANLARGLQTVGAITRYFSAVNTQYNPIFGVVNLIRDVQTGLINLESTPIAGMQKQVAGDFMPAIKGIWSQLRAEAKGGSGTGPWAALFKEFEEYGGPTGYRDMFASSDDRAKMIESEIKALSQGKAKAALFGIGSMLSDYNTAFENGVRLAAYKAARDIRSTLYPKGMSQEQAASLAKNLTVNFNRKGDIALQAGALYAFFNASVQGTARILQTMTRIENGKIVITPLGNKIIRGGLLLGVVQAVALAAAGFDDDNPPQFVREKNIIIPLMNGKYLTVPMPLGFNLLPNLSRNVTEWGMSGFKNTPKRITSLFESVLTGLNPFGGGFSVQTLVPTVIDPLVALYGNTDSFGRKIAREDFSSLRETPGYLRTKDTATPWSKGLSEFLNYASGGTKYMKGALSPTPDQIDYLIGQATGGVGRELGKISQTVSSTATGEELPSTKIPLLSRFYGDTEESASQSNKYYTNLSRINSYAAEIKGRIGHPGTGTVSEFIQDVPEARLVPLATATYTAIQKIEKLKKQAIERNLPKERIRQFEKLAQDRMKQFNQRVDAFQR